MMMMFRMTPWFCLLTLFCLACDSSSDDGATGGSSEPMEGLSGPMAGMTPQMSTGGSDQSMMAGTPGTMTPTMGGQMTMAMGGEAGPAMPNPNPNVGPPPSPVNDCASACARYVECDKAVDVFGEGGESVCLQECERATRGGDEPAQAWWMCLSEDQCNVINRCPRPSVDPLECAEICELVTSCEVGINFPDCAATCAENEASFRGCGENLFGQCDPAGFESCLGRDVYSDCGSYCSAVVGCNVAREEGCERECINQFIEGDPLTLVNFQRTNGCVQVAQRSMDCQAMDACVQPFSFEPPAIPTQAQFCERYDACDLGSFNNECAEEYASLLSRGAAYLTCIFDSITAQCPRTLFSVILECEDASDRLIADACGRFCTARSSCEEMPVDAAMCTSECQMAFTEDPDQNERIQNQILCIRENTCPTFNACVAEASPAGQCERFCASRQACGDVEVDCVEQCNAQWPRDRHAIWRECVKAAGEDCNAVNACTLPPTVPCIEACARRDECNLGVARCVEVCDDQQVTDPINTALEVACILAAPVCQPAMGQLSVAACIQDPLSAGTECLNFCRAKTGCDPAADISTCLTGCVNGFKDAEGVRFNQARECLGQLAQDAQCDALNACIPAEATMDCEIYCDQLSACQLQPIAAPAGGNPAPSGGAPAGGMNVPAAGMNMPAGGNGGSAGPVAGMDLAGGSDSGGNPAPVGGMNLPQGGAGGGAPAQAGMMNAPMGGVAGGMVAGGANAPQGGDPVGGGAAGGENAPQGGELAGGAQAPQGGVAGGAQAGGADAPEGGSPPGGMAAPQGGVQPMVNGARAACVAACEAEPPLDSAGCILEALRTDQKCGGVAECLEVEPPVVGEKCQAYCAAQAQCDRTFDTYLCHLTCVDNPPYLANRLACFEAAACEDFARCNQLTEERDDRCDDVCATAVACMAIEEDECYTKCTGQLASPRTPENHLDTITGCLNSARPEMPMCEENDPQECPEVPACNADIAATCFQPKWCDGFDSPVIAPIGGGIVNVNIANGPEGERGDCGGGNAQQAIVVTIQQPTNASFTVVEHDFDPVIYLRSECDDAASMILCNDDANGQASRIPEDGGVILLQPGTYFLIVDSFFRPADGRGAAQVNIALAPAN